MSKIKFYSIGYNTNFKYFGGAREIYYFPVIVMNKYIMK